jgi:serine/threonine protein kinase
VRACVCADVRVCVHAYSVALLMEYAPLALDRLLFGDADSTSGSAPESPHTPVSPATPRRLSAREQRHLALGIARGVAHLHANNVVHRDLAARNIVRWIVVGVVVVGVCQCRRAC